MFDRTKGNGDSQNNANGDGNSKKDANGENGDDVKGYDKEIGKKYSRDEATVRKLLIDNYGFQEGDPYLDSMVDREMHHGRVIKDFIGKKRHFQNKADRDGNNPDQKDKGDDSEVLVRNRSKAAKQFLEQIGKDYPDLGGDKIKETYAKVKSTYSESGDETSVEDFVSSMNKAFENAYPEHKEDRIREEERKKVREQDGNMDFSGLGSGDGESGEKRKPGGRRLLKFSRINPKKDWYPKKD